MSAMQADATSDPVDGLMTAAALAKVLGVSRRSVDRYAAGGMFKPVRLGGRLTRFRVSDVRRAIDALEPTSAAGTAQA